MSNIYAKPVEKGVSKYVLSDEEKQAIEKAVISGVKGIFTMHGKTIEDVKNNKDINRLIEKNILEKIIFI